MLHLSPLLSVVPIVLLISLHRLLLSVHVSRLAYLCSKHGIQYTLSSAERFHSQLLQVVVCECESGLAVHVLVEQQLGVGWCDVEVGEVGVQLVGCESADGWG